MSGRNSLGQTLAALRDPIAALAGGGLAAAGAIVCSQGRPAPGGGLVLLGVTACVVQAWRLVQTRGRLERLADQLGRPVRGLTLDETAALIAERLEGHAHRTAQLHPTTGLPTREHLLANITADVAAGRANGLLGVVRLADFSRLAAFDEAGAAAALDSFARRLSASVSPLHVVAQVDRDCFAVWFRGVSVDAATAEFRALTFIAEQEIVKDGGVLTPTVETSLVTQGAEGGDPQGLVTQALGVLTRSGVGGGVESLAPRAVSLSAAKERFTLEQDLARAIANDQLAMVFQPVVDLSKGRLAGAEALLRWKHPTLGYISPGRFIPMVEDLGLSERYGAWVLNAACREARRWRDDGLLGLKMAVNLSAHQLLDEQLPVKIDRTLQRHGLAPEALELELTETAAMADAERTLALFRTLRSTGVSLSIDDFGSGYSSMSYLKKLPFDKLKIDREFVVNVESRRDSQAICKALIELSAGLGLTVLAEGVESASEVAALWNLGCPLFQGFFFSRPLSGDDFRSQARDPAWRQRLSTETLTADLAPSFQVQLSA